MHIRGHLGVVAVLDKEWGEARGLMCCIVVCKLCKRQELRPVVLLVVGVDSEVLLQILVDSLGLAIAFGVVTGGEVKVHV